MNVLEVQGLTKRYPAFTLDHVSFDVPQGAVMGFIGRNGAAMSTTLKSILGMVHPDEGAVRVFGMDYAANEAAIRRSWAWCWRHRLLSQEEGGHDHRRDPAVLRQLGRGEVPPLFAAVRAGREQAGGSAVQRHEGEVT